MFMNSNVLMELTTSINMRFKSLLNSKAKQASLLVLIAYGLSQILRLTSNLLLTRLLIPEMFGVMALALTFVYIIVMISDVGIETSVIRSKSSDSPKFLQTAWTMQIIRGVFLAIIVLCVAFIISYMQKIDFFLADSAFDAVVLPKILAILALNPFISGFRSMKVALAHRNLSYGRLSVIELLSQIFSLAIMLILAATYKNVWALVVGAVASNLILTILGHSHLPGNKDLLGWDKKYFKEIFHFGKWLVISSLITALLTQGDRLIFGNFVSSEQLGIYSIALLLSTAAKDVLLKLNSKVFFPKLSDIQRNEQSNIAEVYYAIRKKTDSLSFLIAGCLLISGPSLVQILFDIRYHYAGNLLSILGLQLLFTSTIVSSALYLSVGKPKFHTVIVFTEALFKLSLIYILFHFGGIELAVYGCAFFALFVLPIDFYFKAKLKVLKLSKEVVMLPFFIIGMFLGHLLKAILS